ncbi:unnamed protein product [Brassicogethes aeneus]|uniref:BED-type domain-containing protein n=1 Tax=Brassicogethes aeneus TaxID=1431903 RepID=A0A9P0B0F6_BRAAE|nr:unnamed protein product [Brassicogethes aeneus]
MDEGDLVDPYENLSDDDPEYFPGREEDDLASAPKKRKLTQYFQMLTKPKDKGNGSAAAAVAPSSDPGSSATSVVYLQKDHQAKFNNSPMLDGKFYKVIKFDGKDHVEASCQLCLPNHKVIKGSAETTTNFVKHLRRMHLTGFSSYIKYKSEKQMNRQTVEITSPTLSSSKLR